MGIRGLVPFLRKHHPDVLRPVTVDLFRGKRVALDGTLLLHRTYRAFYDTRSALAGWHNLLVQLRSHGIEVICVFDGPTRPPLKANETRRRRRLVSEAGARVQIEDAVSSTLAKLVEAAARPGADARAVDLRARALELQAVLARRPGPPPPPLARDDGLEPAAAQLPFEVHRAQRAAGRAVGAAMASYDGAPTAAAIDALRDRLAALQLDSQTRGVRLRRLHQGLPPAFASAGIELAQALGLPTYTPPIDLAREAEELAASLVRHDATAAVGSEDTDSLVHGASLLRGLSHQLAADRPDSALTLIDPRAVLSALDMSEGQFVDFCILCGSDYPGHIRDIGPTRALALLRTHGGIEAVAAHLADDDHVGMRGVDRTDYLATVDAVRALYLDRQPAPVVEPVTARVDQARVDDLLERFPIVETSPLQMPLRAQDPMEVV